MENFMIEAAASSAGVVPPGTLTTIELSPSVSSVSLMYHETLSKPELEGAKFSTRLTPLTLTVTGESDALPDSRRIIATPCKTGRVNLNSTEPPGALSAQ